MLTALALAALAAPPPAVRASDPPAVLQRVAVVGASVSRGFGLLQELEVEANLSDFVAGAVKGDAEEVRCYASLAFFQSPVEKGREQLAELEAFDPTLVVGVDFLFWFGYGALPGEDLRMRLLEQGLALLAQLECPLILSEFPDMRPALKGSSPLMGGGSIIQPEQIPEAATLRRLNARLKEWARGRDNVHLLPLGELLDAMRAGREVTVGAEVLPPEEVSGLLQSDLLHTTVRGSAVLTLYALHRFAARRPDLSSDELAGSSTEVVESVQLRTEPAREKLRERRRRREELRRKRAERAAGESGGGRSSAAA